MLEESSYPKLPLTCRKTFKNNSLQKHDNFVVSFGSVEKVASAPTNFAPFLFHGVNLVMTHHHHHSPSLKTTKSEFRGKKAATGFS